jgi:hypothetical protein
LKRIGSGYAAVAVKLQTMIPEAGKPFMAPMDDYAHLQFYLGAPLLQRAAK